MASPVYSEYSFTPASAYGANKNILPDIRTLVQSHFTDLDWANQEAGILAVDIRSASTFTVKLNRETEIQATEVSGVFIVQYRGPIEYIVFSAQTTVTSFWVAWAQETKSHNVPAITALSGATVAMYYRDEALPVTSNGSYEMQMGVYKYTVAGLSGYIFYNLGSAIALPVSIENATVTLGSDLAYTGSEQTKNISSVTVGGVSLASGTDYTVSGNKGTNAGAYTMTIKGNGTTAIGEKQVQWSIAKKATTMSVSPTTLSLVAGGAAGEITVTTDGDGALSAVSGTASVATATLEGTTAAVNGLTAGESVITISQSAGNNYLAATDATCTVTVTAE